ncbi:hypothetical protein H5410_003911 [Solanum commersonii]|uniref:Uncharacterized protein n=1 Tax=Solanum commersonii TaxID=4109 RepID=A0A9J6B6G4_SOLCO|nr:hypothetical protein H5410_003911 [Solanum commersonii]
MTKSLYFSLFFLSFVVALFGILPNMLRNDPFVSKGDIHGLLSTVLHIAQKNNTSTYKLVKSILKQPIKDPYVKPK